LQVYPFPFDLQVVYTVNNDLLTVDYIVKNTGDDQMYFSVGGHPAFKVPLTDDTSYNDYYLHFNQTEQAGRWPISKSGLIQHEPVPFLEGTQVLPLTKDLFKEDALVFKHLQSDAVTLSSAKTTHGLTFTFAGFPYLGIWAAPNADFVCIEPWCGIADSVNSDQQLAHKEGIIPLPPADVFKVSWSAYFY